MGAAKLELAEGFRRLPSTSAICSRKMPMRDLSNTGTRTCRIAKLEW